MKLKELTVSVSRKINLGNYESKGILIGATVALEETDDMLEAKQELTNRLNQFLEFEVKRIRNNGSGQKTAAPSLAKRRIPRLYETENIKLEDKMIYEHYFVGAFSWYVAEKEGNLCFGYVRNLAHPEFSEWGYFDLEEIKKVRGEKDLWFKPKKFKELQMEWD